MAVDQDRWLAEWGFAREVSPDRAFAQGRLFSFTLDGQPSGELMASWEYSADWDGEAECWWVRWRDAASGVCVTAEIQPYSSFGAVYYVLHIANEGARDTPIFEHILPLDAEVSLSPEGGITLHHCAGSSNTIREFLPLETRLEPGERACLEPVGGRSSNGDFPFFNLTWAGAGLVVALGWSGQWRAVFERQSDGGLHLQGGMAQTHLRLHPGESIRTPGILLLPWEDGDWFAGQNKLRRLMLAHFTPRDAHGKLIQPPVAHFTAYGLHMYSDGWRGSDEAVELRAIEYSVPLGVEAYWLDAYYFPGYFPDGVGNWTWRQDDFPRGLKPLGDAAHANDLIFIVWFEPERVGRGTQLDREHPEWILDRAQVGAEGPQRSRLLNLGDPDARRHVTELMSGLIEEAGIDVYRQDFNIDPLPFWQANDTADRQGMTEIRHIEALYTFWDELLARHPGLWIDNCSSGGRRIDLETCRRSLHLWRSDTPDLPIWYDPAKGSPGLVDQVQTAGLSLWVPLHSCGVWGLDPYRFRSAVSAGIVIDEDVSREEFPQEEAIRAIRELKSLRPYFLGDLYLLTEVTTNEDDWCAYQFHRHDLDAGFAVYFRRPNCASPDLVARLREIDSTARYRVALSESYDRGQPNEMTGAELSGLTVSVNASPGSMLLRYEKVA